MFKIFSCGAPKSIQIHCIHCVNSKNFSSAALKQNITLCIYHCRIIAMGKITFNPCIQCRRNILVFYPYITPQAKQNHFLSLYIAPQARKFSLFTGYIQGICIGFWSAAGDFFEHFVIETNKNLKISLKFEVSNYLKGGSYY